MQRESVSFFLMSTGPGVWGLLDTASLNAYAANSLLLDSILDSSGGRQEESKKTRPCYLKASVG